MTSEKMVVDDHGSPDIANGVDDNKYTESSVSSFMASRSEVFGQKLLEKNKQGTVCDVV